MAACTATPTRWERSGTAASAQEEADCRATAHAEAVERLPYGDGPPLYGFYSNVSRLQWTQAIDQQRYYLERDLMFLCMRGRGYDLVPVAAPAR
jgi:hypothetical protein